MHVLIYAFAGVPNRDSALSAGRITFDERDTTVAGPARRGDLPAWPV